MEPIIDARLESAHFSSSFERWERLCGSGLWSYDLGSHRLSLSANACRLAGIDPNSFEGRPTELFDRLHPEDRRELSTWIDGWKQGEAIGKAKFRVLRADRSSLWLHFEEDTLAGPDDARTARTGVVRVSTGEADRSEQRAKEAELNRIAAEFSRVGSWSVELETGEVRWSKMMYELLGVPLDEDRSSENALSYCCDEDRWRLREAYERCLTTGEPYDLELTFITTEGNRLPIRAIAGAERGPDGAVVKLVGSFQDFTAEMRHRSRLSLAEQRFQLLAKATNDAIWDWDMASSHLWWNEGFTSLFGYEREETLQSFEFWSDLIHPEDRARIDRSIEELFESQQSQWSAEYRFRHRNGRYADVFDRGYVIRDGDGRAIRMLGSMLDISRQKQTQYDLAQQAELLNQANDAILVCDLKGRLEYLNRKAEELYDLRLADTQGQRLACLLYDTPSDFEEPTRAVLGSGYWSGEQTQRSQRGEELVIFGRWTLLHSESGEPRAILLINSDVTEKRELERQLLQTQRMESIGRLASGIAHDLNNVLSPILVSLELLKEQYGLEQENRLLETLESSALRGAELVRQILGLTRGFEGQPITIDPFELVQEVRSIAQETFPKNIDIQLTRPDEIWSLEVDPTQLHQVLMNLVVNARDAMPFGGRLTLSIENVEVDDVFAGMRPRLLPGPYLRITVEDTGVGIPDELKEKIFEPFFTTKERGQGTGLGLSTCFTLIAGLGGHIELKTQLGKGTSVQLYLPAQPSAVPTPVSAQPRAEIPQGQGETVLLVDDEETVLVTTGHALRRNGYRVLVARNGAEGVSTYLQNRDSIACVVTDISMPIMDGPALILALRSVVPEVKIIGSSGLTSKEQLNRTLEVEVDEFVPKPYTTNQLLDTIGRTLMISPHVEKLETSAAPREAPVDGAPPLPEASGARILVVEDEALLRSLAARLLSGRSYTVETAEEGQQALELLDRAGGEFDLVITDLNMPILDGEELYHRAIKLYPTLKFLFTSGDHSLPQSLVDAHLPSPRVLYKPYSVVELREAVEAALRSR